MVAYQFIVNGAGIGIGQLLLIKKVLVLEIALSVAPIQGVANLELIGLGNADNDELGYVNFMSQSAQAASIGGLRHDTSGKLVFTANVERMRITNGDVVEI